MDVIIDIPKCHDSAYAEAIQTIISLGAEPTAISDLLVAFLGRFCNIDAALHEKSAEVRCAKNLITLLTAENGVRKGSQAEETVSSLKNLFEEELR